MSRLLWLLVVLSGALIPNPTLSALIPPFFINSVVTLGNMQSQPALPGQNPVVEWQNKGTGFFYGYLIKDDPEPTKRQYEVYLVTARHVVEEHLKVQSTISVRVNPTDSSSRVSEFSLGTKDLWFYHPNPGIDVAAISVNLQFLREGGFEVSFFTNDVSAANTEKLKSLGVAAGDGVFVLGFPMNISGVQRNYVIVRQGVIARIAEMLDHASSTFLLDAFVFPGNSGSPVVLKPELFSIAGTPGQSTAYLIGLVTSYRPYNEMAISTQTGHPRVIFEENSGLAEVLPVGVIDELIQARRATIRPNITPK